MEVRTLGSESTFCKGTIGAKPRLYAASCGQNHVEQRVIAFECHQIRKWRHKSSGKGPAAGLALFRAALNQDFMPNLRTATNGGWALGIQQARSETISGAGHWLH